MNPHILFTFFFISPISICFHVFPFLPDSQIFISPTIPTLPMWLKCVCMNDNIFSTHPNLLCLHDMYQFYHLSIAPNMLVCLHERYHSCYLSNAPNVVAVCLNERYHSYHLSNAPNAIWLKHSKRHMATCLTIHSFARTAHLFACSAPLALFACSTALICLLARLPTHSRACWIVND